MKNTTKAAMTRTLWFSMIGATLYEQEKRAERRDKELKEYRKNKDKKEAK